MIFFPLFSINVRQSARNYFCRYLLLTEIYEINEIYYHYENDKKIVKKNCKFLLANLIIQIYLK